MNPPRWIPALVLALTPATCANSATSYCQTKTTSIGCTPTMTADPGCAILSGPAWHVTATGLMSQTPGMILIGGVKQNLLFQGGRLCVGLVLLQPQVQWSGGGPPPQDCSGSLSVDVTTFIPVQFYGPTFAQAYTRDPGDPFGVSLSDGIEFEVIP